MHSTYINWLFLKTRKCDCLPFICLFLVSYRLRLETFPSLTFMISQWQCQSISQWLGRKTIIRLMANSVYNYDKYRRKFINSLGCMSELLKSFIFMQAIKCNFHLVLALTPSSFLCTHSGKYVAKFILISDSQMNDIQTKVE